MTVEAPKRLLMVCYYYPPVDAVGVHRSVAFSEELRKIGWDVTVLTVKECKDPWTKNRGGTVPVGMRIERARELNLSAAVDFLHGCLSRVARFFGRELRTNYFRELCIPDPQIAWLVLPKMLRLTSQHDAIYVSCSPFSAAVAASIVRRLRRVRLVVDFRDPWTLNPHFRRSALHLAIARRLERFVLRSADRIILNTDGARRLYERHYPDFRAKYEVVPNGYDIVNTATRVITSPFRIMHFGNFYGTRNARPLLEALATLNLPDVEFVQVGGALPEYDEFRDRLRIRLVPQVPRAESLELMKEATLLYLKQGWEPGMTDYVAVAAKTYEYICSGIPILADLPPGDNLDIVRTYAARSYVVSHPESVGLAEAILAAHLERSEFRPVVNAEFLARFHRASLAPQVSACLISS